LQDSTPEITPIFGANTAREGEAEADLAKSTRLFDELTEGVQGGPRYDRRDACDRGAQAEGQSKSESDRRSGYGVVSDEEVLRGVSSKLTNGLGSSAQAEPEEEGWNETKGAAGADDRGAQGAPSAYEQQLSLAQPTGETVDRETSSAAKELLSSNENSEERQTCKAVEDLEQLFAAAGANDSSLQDAEHASSEEMAPAESMPKLSTSLVHRQLMLDMCEGTPLYTQSSESISALCTPMSDSCSPPIHVASLEESAVPAMAHEASLMLAEEHRLMSTQQGSPIVHQDIGARQDMPAKPRLVHKVSEGLSFTDYDVEVHAYACVRGTHVRIPSILMYVFCFSESDNMPMRTRHVSAKIQLHGNRCAADDNRIGRVVLQNTCTCDQRDVSECAYTETKAVKKNACMPMYSLLELLLLP
jgi:hypothetical protein